MKNGVNGAFFYKDARSENAQVFADGPLVPSVGRRYSLWVTGCCCHKMAKGGKLEPRNWLVLAHLW